MGELRLDTDLCLNKAMRLLASQPGCIFIGQNVAYDGNVVFKHLDGIPEEQRIELPVAEEMQMGMSIGLAIAGSLPVSVYPRLDFIMLAMNQLVNHLDKLPIMSDGCYKPKVIIRTKVGSKSPLDAGPQHTQDHTEALKLMLKTVTVEKIRYVDDIMPVYERALLRPLSTLVIEALD